MKTFVLTMAAMAAHLVLAQDRADYFPKCSLECLNDATTEATNCALDDGWCWCIQSNYEAIYRKGTLCIVNTCGADVALDEVLPAAVPFCSAATSLHQAATTSAAQASSSAAPATTTSVSEVPAVSSSAESSAAAETQVSVSSSHSSASISSAPASVSAPAVPSVTHSTVVTPSPSVNGTAPSGTPVVPNGAATAGSAGMVAMLALGALAAGL